MENTVIKVEIDVDVLSEEEEAIDLKSDEVYISSSSLPVKPEPKNYMEILKVEPTSCSETCVTSFVDGNKATDVKVEVTDPQEEDPLLVTLPVVPAEHEEARASGS
ncbi:uncharacterized protein LOC111862681 isoform X3 [Cryptotermes secundus]|uniref:uncharacterized protein LOC111862681 isoform X3 n=1 Tax=Cryptotermes secundus TaxID=105785 RepID=UPI000CD7AAC8|nr:uncharacterized protein LOC111862681 isoform X3 [Cryptotermes secundus]